MGEVRRHVRPDLPPAVGDAVSAFGYGVRVAIIGYIHEHGPATRGQLATGLGLVPKTVQFHLTGLTALGVVIPDPPPEQARRGQRTRYEIDAGRVLELYAELGKHLGIGEPPVPSRAQRRAGGSGPTRAGRSGR